MPEEDKVEITTLSENALYYFGQRELQDRLVLIEDLDGAENVLYPLIELQSKKFITKTLAQKTTTRETKTVHIKVKGPVSVAGCTTREQVYEDNANRSFLIYIDESNPQDERIMAYQRKRSAGTVDRVKENEVKRLLQNTQRVLQPVPIRNPYAEQLQLPAGVFKPRRTNAHYSLTFCRTNQNLKQAKQARLLIQRSDCRIRLNRLQELLGGKRVTAPLYANAAGNGEGFLVIYIH